MLRRKTMLNALLVALLVISFWALQGRAEEGPRVRVSGGITLNNVLQRLLFTWNSKVPVTGSDWEAGENVSISLHGPLNSPGVAPGDLPLGVLTADSEGELSGVVTIPFDSGISGPSARIPRPGYYEVRATGGASGTAVAAHKINLCPSASLVAGLIDWGRERGGRDGVLPGFLHDLSPERTEPEWAAVWGELPVAASGIIAESAAGGDEPPSLISPSDFPTRHYAHDANFFFQPDPAFRWIIGTANYFQNLPEQTPVEVGRMEIEWETLNAGTTFAYGLGNIGLPLYANPTAGDRIFTVGRWILDTRHPEGGSRTEIHPPRMMATIRKRPSVTQDNGSRATQVDIYVSGHGGGANQFPSGLSQILGQGGLGGGRIQDALNASDQALYYRAGPLPPPLVPVFGFIAFQLTGLSLLGPIFPTAGPSAFSWGTTAPEFHPVNDMDYDFDVALPPAPDEATAPRVEVITHAQHSTAVTEVITYTGKEEGLPTTAHIHLPYLGADNGIYARTLKFAWDVFSPPRKHFRVSVDRIRVRDSAGEWRLWADVSGQWINVTNLAPAKFLPTANGQVIDLPGTVFDVYLRNNQKLRVLTQGYRAACLDHLFGQFFGVSALSPYLSGLALFQMCGLADNQNLGSALLELPARPSVAGHYVVDSTDGSPAGSHFQMEVTVEFIPGDDD
jgi:hypothetical protein